jgi:hypothetical protein
MREKLRKQRCKMSYVRGRRTLYVLSGTRRNKDVNRQNVHHFG